MTRAMLFGLQLDLLDSEESLLRCVELVEARVPSQHAVVNAGKIVMAHDDPVLASMINDADIVNADGMAVVWAGRFLGVDVPERVAGIDLMDRLLAEAQARSWPVFFLGARQDVLQRFVTVVRAKYPTLVIAGSMDGYFSDDELAVRAVRASGARILFLGMSSPKKEVFVAGNSQALGPVLSFGVGGSFDVWAGETTRAPIWMQRSGLEWFHRFLQEPGRMWKRYLVGNARFLFLTLSEKLRGSS